jgi:RNA polymerase sigma-70 factor (ECF subfamily)
VVAVGDTIESDDQGMPAETPLDVTAVYASHAELVWASLQRLGVREADLEDMFQEVFVVVQRRIHTFEARSRMSTWLFGICMRVAAGYRRRGYVRHERATDPLDHTGAAAAVAAPGASPEDVAAAHQANARLATILDQMDLDKRAVFVMAEIEEMSCDAIAALLGVPVGTVYSRLHRARRQFEDAIAGGARDAREGSSR